jgi:hypothetical protein
LLSFLLTWGVHTWIYKAKTMWSDGVTTTFEGSLRETLEPYHNLQVVPLIADPTSRDEVTFQSLGA